MDYSNLPEVAAALRMARVANLRADYLEQACRVFLQSTGQVSAPVACWIDERWGRYYRVTEAAFRRLAAGRRAAVQLMAQAGAALVSLDVSDLAAQAMQDEDATGVLPETGAALLDGLGEWTPPDGPLWGVVCLTCGQSVYRYPSASASTPERAAALAVASRRERDRHWRTHHAPPGVA